MKSLKIIFVSVLMILQVKSESFMGKYQHLEDVVNNLVQDVKQLKSDYRIGKRGATGNAVAFSAHVNYDDSLSPGQVIVFDSVQTNVGNAYDNAQGKFTCPVNGVYFFTVTFLSHLNHLLTAYIKHDGTAVAGIYTIGAGPSVDDQSTNSAVVHCTTGQQVWVESENNYFLNGERIGFTLFSGFLITPDEETEVAG